MKIQIDEVWNPGDRRALLTILDVPLEATDQGYPFLEFRGYVSAWIQSNRPELKFVDAVGDHGYQAREKREDEDQSSTEKETL